MVRVDWGLVSRHCLGQKTVVVVMNNSREEAGFDATQFGLFSDSSGLFDAWSCINFAHLCVLHKRDNKKITIELDNNQTHKLNQRTKARVYQTEESGHEPRQQRNLVINQRQSINRLTHVNWRRTQDAWACWWRVPSKSQSVRKQFIGFTPPPTGEVGVVKCQVAKVCLGWADSTHSLCWTNKNGRGRK